jgi:hypothetical protein
MPIIEGGVSGNKAEVDAGFLALRSAPRPIDVGAGGAYITSFSSGLMTGASMAAAAPVMSLRWSSATLLCIIRKFEMKVFLPTSVTGAQEVGVEAFIARGFSASDSGGTAIVTSGNNCKKRTSHATSAFAVADIQMGGVAAITAGTRTLDSSPFATARFWELATGAAVQHNREQGQFNGLNPATYPIVLVSNGSTTSEGIVIQLGTAFTASGTMRLTVSIEWEELASYGT